MGVFNSLKKDKGTSQKSGGLFNQIKSTRDEDNQRKYVEGMKNTRLMEVDTLKTKQAEEKKTKTAMQDLGIDLAGNMKRFGEFKSGIDAVQKVKDDKKAADRQKLADSRADTRKGFPGPLKWSLEQVDYVADKIKPATDIAESFYTPAAGLTAINGLTKGASYGLSKLLPGLAGSIGGRAAKTALTEGIVGAPLGLANTLAQNPEASNRELLINTGLGAGGGAVLGGAGRLIGEGIEAGLRKGTQSLLAPTLDNTANMGRSIEVAMRTTPNLELPAPRVRGNANNVNTPDVINVPETSPRGLPEPSQRLQRLTRDADESRNAIDDINNELVRIDSGYQRAVNDQYQLLKKQLNERGGVQQGNIIRDEFGDVTNRYGRQSNNPQWYQEFFAQYGKAPSNKELYSLAKKQVDEGYSDSGFDIPSWRQENQYDDTRSALLQTRRILGESADVPTQLGIPDVSIGERIGRAPSINAQPLRSQTRTEVVASSPTRPRVDVTPPSASVNGTRQSDVERKVAKLDEDFKVYKDNINRQVSNGILMRDEAGKQLKGRAMAIAAQKRELLQGDSLIPVEGGLTGKELSEKIRKLNTNYVGKEVIANGVEGKVKGVSFGRVSVEFPDGTVKTFDQDSVVPKKSVDDLIREQTQAKAQKQVQQTTRTVNPSPVAPVATVAPIAPIPQSRPLRTTINERGNISTQRAGNLSVRFNRGLSARDNTYEQISNAESVAKANENVKNLSDAEARFLGNKEFSAEHVATGYRLLQELDRMGETQRALNISEKLAADLTSAGQTAQAASILKRLSPEGQLLHLQRVASSAGKEISVTDAKLYTDLARDVQMGSTAGKETSDFLDVLAKLKAGQEVTPDEMLKATAILEDAKKFIKSGRQSPERLPREMKDVRTRDRVVSFLDEAEQSALARIKARRNQLNALPLGEWADHAIVASSQIAKGTIRAATYAEDMVRLFGEEVRPYAQAIYTEARKLLNGSSKNISEGNVKEASEAFERLRNSQTPAGKVAEKFIKEREIKAGDVEKLRDLAKQLNDLKGANAQEADMQMQAILNKYQKANAWDRIQAIRYIAMLFNTSTQAVNALSGPIVATTNYAADLLGGLVDASISVLSRGARQRTTQIYAANPLKFIARYVKNAGTGARAGWRGVSPSGITGTGDVRGLTYKSLYNPLGILERSLGAVSKGADYATYKTVATGELERQAKLAASRTGVKGSERKEFIEKFMLNPPDEAQEIADRVGKNVTFQRMDRAGGKVANSINNSNPLLKIPANTIVPFVKTPLNIAEHAIDLTPVGAIRGIIKLSRKGASEADRRDAIQRLGLSLVGGGLSATGFYLNQIGVITGNNESGDIDVDKLKESVGQGKYRLNVDGLGRYARAMLGGKGVEAAEKAAKYQSGDSQIDYNKFQPLALPLAAGAAASEHRKDGVESQLQSVAVDAGSSLFSMSALRGIQDAFQAPAGVTGAEKATAPIKKVFESFIKSFSPGLLAQETNRRDDTVRKVSYNEGILQNVKEYFMSRTPGLSTKLPPKVDYFGSEVKKPSGIVGAYLNPYRSQVASNTPAARKLAEIYDATGDKGVAPGTLNNGFKGKDIKTGEITSKKLDNNAYAKLQKKLGELQSTMINKIPDNLTPEQKAYLVDKIYEFTRSGATLAAKQQLGIMTED